jgi:hypothetical protein
MFPVQSVTYLPGLYRRICLTTFSRGQREGGGSIVKPRLLRPRDAQTAFQRETDFERIEGADRRRAGQPEGIAIAGV